MVKIQFQANKDRDECEGFKPGDIREVTDECAERLQCHFPGNFTVVKKAAPVPENKMITPDEDKSGKGEEASSDDSDGADDLTGDEAEKAAYARALEKKSAGAKLTTAEKKAWDKLSGSE